MFHNIGGKIKTLAVVITVIGIVASVLAGVIVMGGRGYPPAAGILFGLLTIIGGCLVSWIGSFLIYGFGQLIENTDILAGRDGK